MTVNGRKSKNAVTTRDRLFNPSLDNLCFGVWKDIYGFSLVIPPIPTPSLWWFNRWREVIDSISHV